MSICYSVSVFIWVIWRFYLVAAASSASNEAHRMKMAASLHQRVVVGEDKPANNNMPRDGNRAPHDSPSAEDRHRIYQGRSRDVIELRKQ